MENQHPENSEKYLSTRQTARQLQVSLGTVQKMVETGELLAWKTKGGHRRILQSSMQKILRLRRDNLRYRSTEEFMVLAVLNPPELYREFTGLAEAWQAKIDLHLTCDATDALMKAACLEPDLIYIDASLSDSEHHFILTHLGRNRRTRQISVLVNSNYLMATGLPTGPKEDYPEQLDNPRRHECSPALDTRQYVDLRMYQHQEFVLENQQINLRFARQLEEMMRLCLYEKHERGIQPLFEGLDEEIKSQI